ncbi:hypothetical protein Bca101_066712 [Brassica carinata]
MYGGGESIKQSQIVSGLKELEPIGPIIRRILTSLLLLSLLYTFYVQDNLLTGTIPPLNQTSLRYCNWEGISSSPSIQRRVSGTYWFCR